MSGVWPEFHILSNNFLVHPLTPKLKKGATGREFVYEVQPADRVGSGLKARVAHHVLG